MMRLSPHSLAGRLLAWSVTVAVGLGCIAYFALPPIHAAASLHDAARIVQPPAKLTSSPPKTIYSPTTLFAEHIDDADARLALQSIVDSAATGSGLAMRGVRPVENPAAEVDVHVVWMEAKLSGDLLALTDFLTALDGLRPIVLLRRLELTSDPAALEGQALRITAEFGRAWRPDSAT